MDTSTIVQLISSLGFPIACCIAMFWQNNKLNESHKEEVSKLNEAINNNTIALNHIIDKLGAYFEKNKLSYEANHPILSAGMIPVKWDGTYWVITSTDDTT